VLWDTIGKWNKNVLYTPIRTVPKEMRIAAEKKKKASFCDNRRRGYTIAGQPSGYYLCKGISNWRFGYHNRANTMDSRRLK
jgi:hypothetical protein